MKGGGRSAFLGLLLVLLAAVSWACGRSENTIIIGSKNFTEQILLGELLAQQIEGTTHYQVKRLFNLGGRSSAIRRLSQGPSTPMWNTPVRR